MNALPDDDLPLPAHYPSQPAAPPTHPVVGLVAATLLIVATAVAADVALCGSRTRNP